MKQETAAWRRPLAFVWRYRRGLGEMLIVFAVMLLYYGTRGMAIGQQDTAIANAHAVIDIESRLGIFREPAINGWVVDHRLAVLVLNWIYTYLHLPVLIAFAIWVYLRRPTQYAAIRNAFLVSAVVGLAMYALYPCAPPRFIPGYGFTDTLADYSAISYEMHSIQLFYNPYAASPSLHFGWSLLVGIGLCWLGRNAFMRAIGIVLPAVMLIAIIGTANHFFFDAIAGSLVMGFGLLIGFWSRLVDVWNGREVLYDSRQ
ncbi:MAG: phosphatase PAP2 family protein [Thermomicrobiales bacterium]